MIPLEMTSVCRTRGRGAHAVQAVRNITLRVDPGEVSCCGDRAVSGKTTLLALAAGLLAADAGTVTVAGLRLDRATESARRQLRQPRGWTGVSARGPCVAPFGARQRPAHGRARRPPGQGIASSGGSPA
jgi:ABC-type Na+ transport system ATPase subunit NatA